MMKRWRPKGLALVSLGYAWLGMLFTSGLLEAQCSMCRTALTNSPEGKALAIGMNQGILFLVAIPGLVVVTLAWLVSRRLKQSAAVLSSTLDATAESK